MGNGIQEYGQVLAERIASLSTGGGEPTPSTALVGDFPVNVTFPLPVIPTYIDTGDSTSQATHVGLAIAPNGVWNGYRYWGVHTPYYGMNDQKEVPFLICANDPFALPSEPGAWRTPPGVTNPVVPPHPQFQTGVRFLSDPTLCFDPDGVTLHMMWRRSDTSTGAISDCYVKSTTDGGVTWSTPVLIAQANVDFSITAPGFFYDAEAKLWRIYYVNNRVSPPTLCTMSSGTLATAWDVAASVTCTATFGSGREPWHLDAIKHEGKTYLSIMDRATGDVSTGRTLLAVDDGGGTAFTVSSAPVLPSTLWSRSYYRPSIAIDKGRMLLGFSSRSTYVTDFVDNRIGFTALDLPKRATIRTADQFASNVKAGKTSPQWPMLGGDGGGRTGVLTTVESGGTMTNRIGAGLTGTTSGLAPTDNVYTYVSWTGPSQGYYEAAFTALDTSGAAFITVKGATTNYWRIGFRDGGATGLVVEARTTSGNVAGAITYTGLTPFRPGIIVGVAWTYSTMAISVDGCEVVRFDTNTYAGQTDIGVGFYKTASKIRGLWWRELLASGV